MKNIEDVYKLSPRQRDLLPARAASRASPFEHLCLRYRGALDEEILRRAAQKLVARHGALRTAFFSEGLKDAVQAVRERVEPAFGQHDLGDVSPEDLAARVEAFVTEDRRRGMNPSVAPLTRLSLLRGREGGALLFGFHPLLLDVSSARACARELLALYEAGLEGREAELERPRPYRDYIAWLEQQDWPGAERHYRSVLQRVHPSPLPGGEEGKVAEEGAAEHHVAQQFVLSSAGTANVLSLLRPSRIGLGTLLQAAWALLLRARGASRDLLFGALVSGRPSGLPGSESIVGRFAGVLPRHITVPEGGSLRRWLRGLEAELADARAYEHTSLEQIRSWLSTPPEAPLFHSVVAVDPLAQDEPLGPLEKRLGVRCIAHLTPAARWPLTVTAMPGSRLAVRFVHDPRRLPALEVVHLTGALSALLEAMVADPDRDVASLLRIAAPSAERRPAGNVSSAGIGPAEIEALLAQHRLVRAAKVAPNEAPEVGIVAEIEIDPEARPVRGKKLDFSLFYFADATSTGADKYRIYLEGAKFADRRGFTAVWTPERHFHENGGLYPNPSVLSAALATVTERVALRAGSVVLPLHHPLRVAEEWSIVDNLSNGRVAISIATGWVPNDFAFAPGTYERRRERMFELLEQVQRLWRGETLRVEDGIGKPTELRVFPRPIQQELPIWLTAAGNPATFEKAGELGYNVLTSLLAQPMEEAAEKIALYRAARARAGHDPEAGTVTMMLHTFIGPDLAEVIDTVRGPFTAYLRSHVGLIETLVKSLDMQVDLKDPALIDGLASFAFDRYQRTSALIGTPTACLAMLDRLAGIGVNEVACLVDFGVGADEVLASLEHLDELRHLVHDDALLADRVLSEHLRERLPGWKAPVAFRLAKGALRP